MKILVKSFLITVGFFLLIITLVFVEKWIIERFGSIVAVWICVFNLVWTVVLEMIREW